MSDAKNQLTTLIERKLHGHIQSVKEASVDFIVLYLRRNNINVDRDSLTKILEIMRVAIDNEHMNSVDKFLSDINSGLEAYAKEVE